MILRFLLLGLVLLATLPAQAAVDPEERLADPRLEERARAITRELRCLVCQNQSIEDSNAPLARDLRRLVRQRLAAGDSDSAVIAYVVARYGDFVLLRPPVKPVTWLLWFGPGVLLVVAGSFLLIRAKRKRAAPLTPAPLSEEERQQLARVLDGGEAKP